MKLFGIVSMMCFWLASSAAAQTPVQKFWALNQNIYLLDQVAAVSAPSFAYSLRKLRRGYPGFSIRVRRGLDNATADVAFDGTDIVSGSSIVTVVSPGISLLSSGSTMSLTAFKGIQQLFVNTWYDQGSKAYHAVQSTSSRQPELVLNSAGTGSSKPSLLYNGSKYLELNQPIQNIVTNGIVGTFLLAARATANSAQHSFGYIIGTEWRWSIHLNWTNGSLYFDAAEPCCDNPRSIFNGSGVGLNLWKQYSLVRGTTYKTVRRSGTTTTLSSTSSASTSKTGGQFFIGSTFGKGADNVSYSGYLTEVIMFPKDFKLSELQVAEQNQIRFWGL